MMKTLRICNKLDLPWSQKTSIVPAKCYTAWLNWRYESVYVFQSFLFYRDVKRTLSLLLLSLHHSHNRKKQRQNN